ncbi:MAG: lysophospholipase [Chloroflexota bacterium]|nr:lysophospholipase [Chloroflexota bacterium]
MIVFVAFFAAVGALGGLVALAVLGIAAYSAHTVIRPKRDWQPEDWVPAIHESQAVHFRNSAGHRLAGWFVPPPPGAAVVIISHGFGTNRREGEDMVPWLGAAGYGTFRFDFQGHGESEGPFTTVGLREVDDYLCAVSYLKERVGSDVPLLAVGLSMGASVAIMAAAQCPEIRAVVADSPFSTLERAVARSFKIFFRLPPRVFTRPTIWFAERFTGGRIGGVMPISAIGAIAPRPLLLVQGTEDAIVNPDDSLLLYAAAGEPKSLWRVDGCGHVGVRSHVPDEYRRRVLRCLAAAQPNDESASD